MDAEITLDDSLARSMRLSTHLNLQGLDEELSDRIASLQRTLTNAQKSLDAGQHVNSLGVVQGNGAQLDITCARRQDANEAARKEAFLLKAAGFDVDAIDASIAESLAR